MNTDPKLLRMISLRLKNENDQNMKRKFQITILFVYILASCYSSQEKVEQYPEADFNIMVISDIHISRDEDKDARLKILIEKLNSGLFSKTECLVMTGDLVSKVYSNKRDGVHLESSNNLAKLMTILNSLNVPNYLLMGNHDYKIDSDKDSDAPFSKAEIDTMEILWKHHTGLEPYYSIILNGWKLIMLNSMRGRYLERSFDPGQLQWLERELSSNQPSILFFHHPIETDHFNFWGKPKDLITPQKESQFFTICEKYKDQIKGIFVGHGHRWIEDTLFESIPVYETESFGENDGIPFYLVGIDTLGNKINVTKISDSRKVLQ